MRHYFMLSLCRASYTAVAELCNHNVFLLRRNETGCGQMYHLSFYHTQSRQTWHCEVMLDTDSNDLYIYIYLFFTAVAMANYLTLPAFTLFITHCALLYFFLWLWLCLKWYSTILMLYLKYAEDILCTLSAKWSQRRIKLNTVAKTSSIFSPHSFQAKSHLILMHFSENKT